MFGTADVAQLLLRGALEPVDAPLFKVGEHRKHFSMVVLQTGIIKFDMNIALDFMRVRSGTQELRALPGSLVDQYFFAKGGEVEFGGDAVLQVTRNLAPLFRIGEIVVHHRVELVQAPVHHLIAQVAHAFVKVALVVEQDKATAREAAHDLRGNTGVIAEVDDVHDHVAIHEQQRKLGEVLQAFPESHAVTVAQGGDCVRFDEIAEEVEFLFEGGQNAKARFRVSHGFNFFMEKLPEEREIRLQAQAFSGGAVQ